MGTAVIILLGAQQQRFPSPSPPKKGGEGRGEEAVFYQFPLSPALSPLVPRGERGKNPSAFSCRTILASRLPLGRGTFLHCARGRRVGGGLRGQTPTPPRRC